MAGQGHQMEVVRSLYEAFNAGDYEASLELMASDVEYHELAGMPGARGMVGVYRGREEVARWFGEFLSEWQSFRSEPSEVTDLGDGRVVVVETWRGRSRRSGVDVEMTAAVLHTIRDGRIACARYFRTPEEAFAAAQPSSPKVHERGGRDA